jgi:hypothetical protein
LEIPVLYTVKLYFVLDFGCFGVLVYFFALLFWFKYLYPLMDGSVPISAFCSKDIIFYGFIM